ncbi:hypothetical protein FACS1894178_6620 [Bacteroidia bacterium]|nr:hypothetical protein FACS1894178_6620 [Bacteroidia bacterium]
MKLRFIIFTSFMLMGKIFAQNNYAVALIPDSLKDGAQAVVREQKEFLLQKDNHNGVYKCSKVITIFNAKGLNRANFIVRTDDFQELKSFSGEVFDASGKSIKKMKQKDLQTLQLTASYELITNIKTIYYEYHSPRFPFTIKYEWELKLKDGILYYPSFAPITAFDIALQYAEYMLQVPDGQIIRYKNVSTDVQPLINGNRYFWKVENLKPIEYERFAPSNSVVPIVYLAPEDFCVQNACGNMKTWENYGNWLSKLQKDRDILPENIKKKVKELTQNMSDTREKVKILYDFMQKTTHYVSIQLGVGGWQSIAASEVARTGFGDCKALSNYMKALLAIAEIPSFYTVLIFKTV